MNLFIQLFLQCVAIIFGLVIVFQLAAKICFKDIDSDNQEK